MKELKIGEEIRIRCVNDANGTTLTNCEKCVFHPCGGHIKECMANYRTDQTNVHFEIVEE